MSHRDLKFFKLSLPNKSLNLRCLPKMCNLIFQQNSESLFDFFKTFLFFHSHSSNSIRPERRHFMRQQKPHIVVSYQIKSLAGGSCPFFKKSSARHVLRSPAFLCQFPEGLGFFEVIIWETFAELSLICCEMVKCTNGWLEVKSSFYACSVWLTAS